jgi:hypothetical protein
MHAMRRKAIVGDSKVDFFKRKRRQASAKRNVGKNTDAVFSYAKHINRQAE